MRSACLVESLREAGHEVVLWTSTFSHQERRHLFVQNTVLRPAHGVEIRLVHSPGYRSNVGMQRIVDHSRLALRMQRLMAHEPIPDAAFVGFPPIETAAAVIRFLKQRNVPVLLDVKDQWPEVFMRAVPDRLRLVGGAALAPYFRFRDYSFTRADGISSISAQFLEWALQVAKRPAGSHDTVVPLTTRMPAPSSEQAERAGGWWDSIGVVDDGRPRAVYIGALTESVDWSAVVDAAERSGFQIVVAGNGPFRSNLERAAEDTPSLVVPGPVDRIQGHVLYGRSTIGLAPYVARDGFDLSIPNKIYDYLAHGLPVVCGPGTPVADLVAVERVGASYGVGVSLSEAMQKTKSDEANLAATVERCTAFHAAQYSYDVVYPGLVRHLEAMAGALTTTTDARR